ncbi:hypothetical protein J6590_069066 [Homalodisca vitripennis]|nr:hypothetical protein J6590_069066 [Homalodisca vitripennis]
MQGRPPNQKIDYAAGGEHLCHRPSSSRVMAPNELIEIYKSDDIQTPTVCQQWALDPQVPLLFSNPGEEKGQLRELERERLHPCMIVIDSAPGHLDYINYGVTAHHSQPPPLLICLRPAYLCLLGTNCSRTFSTINLDQWVVSVPAQATKGRVSKPEEGGASQCLIRLTDTAP